MEKTMATKSLVRVIMRVAVFSEDCLFAQEDWNEPDQDEVPNSVKPDTALTMNMRRKKIEKHACNTTDEIILLSI